MCSCADAHTCAHLGKHPRYNPSTLANGANSATTNASVIREWWRRWPDANVGVAVGPRSGLLALDIDPRNGGDDTFAELVSDLGPLPDTVEAKTGGGGRHLLFKRPGGEVKGKLGAGVDVLGSDGTVDRGRSRPCTSRVGGIAGGAVQRARSVIAAGRVARKLEGEDSIRLTHSGKTGGTGMTGMTGTQENPAPNPSPVDPSSLQSLPTLQSLYPLIPQWSGRAS